MSTVVPGRPLRLTNRVQRYDWGSTDAIPTLLGVEPDGSPWAELWLGAHESAPSSVIIDDEPVSLPELIRNDPIGTLGRRIAADFGPRLPYLFKVLAAGRALSLQVHPKPHLAREGYNAENAAGIPLDAPSRSFLDDKHKPEMVIALTRFEGLGGFRSPRSILAILDGLDGELVGAVRDLLTRSRSEASIRGAFRLLLAARHSSATGDDIAVTVASISRKVASPMPHADAYQTVIDLTDQHPGDPGALASMMLNRVTLNPGEGLFIPSGEVHAYLSGLAIEVMASSDNVLRAGLTTKPVDEEALIRCSSFTPRPPARPAGAPSADGMATHYRAPVDEFAVTIVRVGDGRQARLPDAGPRIVLALDGTVELETEGGWAALAKGESVFVPDSAGPVKASGLGSLACAWVP